MSRIRSIKPEIATSEQFVSCTRDARLLFVLIWNHCDDAGVHTDSVRRVKMELFPADDDATCEKISEWIEELIKVKLLGRFDSGGAKYLYVTGWSKHQSIQRPYFKFPKPPGWTKKHFLSSDGDVSEHITDTAQAPPDTEPLTVPEPEKDTEGKLNTVTVPGRSARAVHGSDDGTVGVCKRLAKGFKAADLADDARMLELWSRWQAEPAMQLREADRLNVFAAWERAKDEAKDSPFGFFLQVVAGRLWVNINAQQEERARRRLAAIDQRARYGDRASRDGPKVSNGPRPIGEVLAGTKPP